MNLTKRQMLDRWELKALEYGKAHRFVRQLGLADQCIICGLFSQNIPLEFKAYCPGPKYDGPTSEHEAAEIRGRISEIQGVFIDLLIDEDSCSENPDDVRLAELENILRERQKGNRRPHDTS